jgi:hypothetical protein
MMSVKNRSYYASIIGLIMGLLVGPLLSALGVLMWQPGVDYYAEVHLSFWNSLVHTLFMPFTYLGFNLAIPALFRIKNPWNIQLGFYTAYMVHYFTIDPITACLTTALYYQVIRLGHTMYMRKFTTYFGYLCTGLVISTVALLIQESFGHYIGGDDPSRMNFVSIFNAMLYAKFYSVQHLVRTFLRQ